MHGADREVVLPHLLRQPVHLALGVAEDDRLRTARGSGIANDRAVARTGRTGVWFKGVPSLHH